MSIFSPSLQVYDNFGDLMDILTLFNNGINFILYCSMSKQFRDRFAQLFIPSSPAGPPTTTVTATTGSTAPNGAGKKNLNGRGSVGEARRSGCAPEGCGCCGKKGGGDKRLSTASTRLIGAGGNDGRNSKTAFEV